MTIPADLKKVFENPENLKFTNTLAGDFKTLFAEFNSVQIAPVQTDSVEPTPEEPA